MKNTMDYIYHYHAIWQPKIGQTANTDGLATMREPISTHGQYLELKDGIAKESGTDAQKLTICSLTLLSPHNNFPAPNQ
jgi:hypothetical protein